MNEMGIVETPDKAGYWAGWKMLKISSRMLWLCMIKLKQNEV